MFGYQAISIAFLYAGSRTLIAFFIIFFGYIRKYAGYLFLWLLNVLSGVDADESVNIDNAKGVDMKVVKMICKQKVFEIVFVTISHAETIDYKVI